MKSRLVWKKNGESLVTSGRSGWGKNIADLCFHNFLIEILGFHKFLIQNFVETQFSNRGTYQEIVFVQKKIKKLWKHKILILVDVSRVIENRFLLCRSLEFFGSGQGCDVN